MRDFGSGLRFQNSGSCSNLSQLGPHHFHVVILRCLLYGLGIETPSTTLNMGQDWVYCGCVFRFARRLTTLGSVMLLVK